MRARRGAAHLRTTENMISLNEPNQSTAVATPIDVFGVKFNNEYAFILLSCATISAIGLSCYLEEYILKGLEGFDYYWTMALAELSVFAVITFGVHLRERKESGVPIPRAAPLNLYVAGAFFMAIYASVGKLAYKYVNYATGTVLKVRHTTRNHTTHVRPHERSRLVLKSFVID